MKIIGEDHIIIMNKWEGSREKLKKEFKKKKKKIKNLKTLIQSI